MHSLYAKIYANVANVGKQYIKEQVRLLSYDLHIILIRIMSYFFNHLNGSCFY